MLSILNGSDFLCKGPTLEFSRKVLHSSYGTVSLQEFFMLWFFRYDVTSYALTFVNVIFLYKHFQDSSRLRSQMTLRISGNSASLPFSHNLWMLKYKGAFKNPTMSKKFKILHTGISWIPAKKKKKALCNCCDKGFGLRWLKSSGHGFRLSLLLGLLGTPSSLLLEDNMCECRDGWKLCSLSLFVKI